MEILFFDYLIIGGRWHFNFDNEALIEESHLNGVY